MSCYINDFEVFAVIKNTILDIIKWKNNANSYESYNFFSVTTELFKDKIIKDELNQHLLKCYKAQVRSYNEHYRENEKVDKKFIETLDSIKVSYYPNKHHKIMLFKSIKCMMYQIEVKFNSKFWDSISDSLVKDIIYKSKEFERAAWGYGEMEEEKNNNNKFFLSYMDPESDDDKFGIMASSYNKKGLLEHIGDDLDQHYPDGEAHYEVEDFLKKVCKFEEEEYVFEFKGRKRCYKITEEWF